MSDDYTADRQTTGVVAVGGTATGEIETAGDQDWFAVELEAGVEYRIDLEGSATGGGTLVDPWLRWLHDADRAGIRGTRDLDGGEGLNARQVFTPTESGIYYISANGAQGQTGSYTLSVTRLTPPAGGTTETLPGPSDTDDPDDGAPPDGTEDGSPPDPPIAPEPTAADLPADTTTTGVVAVGGSVTSEIETVGDLDWFAVELEAGVEYRIDLKGSPTDDGTLLNPVLYGVRTAAGADVAGTFDDNGGEGRNAQERFTATESGVHYIMAGSNHTTGSYLLSVTRTTPAPAQDDPDEVTEDGPSPGPPIAPEPELSVADAEAREGEDAVLRFRVTLDRAAAVAVTVGYATVDGTAVAGEDYEAASGTLTFAAGETELTVEVAVIDDTVEDSGETFTLRLSDPSGAALADAEAIGTIVNSEPVDDPPPVPVSEPADADLPADTTTTGRVVVGGSVTGSIDETAKDEDWFRVELVGGQRYRIDLRAWWSEHGTLFDPYLHGVYDSDGRRISGTWDDNGGYGRESHLTFTPSADGTYYIAAGAYYTGIGGSVWTGSYRLFVEAPVDHESAGTDTDGTVAVGDSTVGEIDYQDDRDWFAVELEAGGVYRIDIKGSWSDRHGTLHDPYLSLQDPRLYGIYDANGNLIPDTQDEDGGYVQDSLLTFTAKADGTHYIAAGTDRSEIGTYEVFVTQVGVVTPDDHTADTGTSGTVAVGSAADGEINHVGDRDWYAVELEAGKTYRIDLEGADTDGLTLYDPYFYGIHDADGNRIEGTEDDHDGYQLNSRVLFVPEADGTYYMAAGADHSYMGTYRLGITEIVPDLAAGTGTSGRVEVGGYVAGLIEHGGDEDWYAVTLEGDTTYRIDLEGSQTGGGTIFNPEITGIYNQLGNYMHETVENGRGVRFNDRVFFTPSFGATYFIGATAFRGEMGTYRLSVREGRDDYAAGTDTSGTVAVGGSATGEIDFQGDRDWFAVELEAGGVYKVELYGEAAGLGTIRWPKLHGVYDSDGNRIDGTEDDNGQRTSRVTFRADADGTHYIAAGSSHDVYTGAYSLSVRKLALDDHRADTDTSATVAVGGSATGNIETKGDRDWFAVDLEAGKSYRIDLEGSSKDHGTLFDPAILGIHDSNGDRIANTGNNNGYDEFDSVVIFTPEADGAYYIAAGSHSFRSGSSLLSYTGSYRLSVTEATVTDDHSADTGTSGTVAVGSSTIGEIETSGDRDWYAVTLDAGTTYRIDLTGSDTGRGMLSDPYLSGIHDSNGDRVAGTGNNNGGGGRDSRVFFTPDAGGTYYVNAGAIDSELGTYRLSVTESEPDVAADTGTGATVAVGGSVTGEIDYEGDRDWFAVTLQAGKSYGIDLEGSWTGQGTLSDPYIRGIYDSSGGLIAGTENDDGGLDRNSRVAFTPDADGTYYIAAGAYNSEVGTYRLSVTEADADHSADTGTSGTVAVGGSVVGEIETFYDQDWFAVDLEAGKTYRIDLEGYYAGQGTLYETHLRGIYDSNGDRIPDTENTDGQDGYNAFVIFTPEAAGTYYIAAAGLITYRGTYRLSVAEVTPGVTIIDDHSADTDSSGTVAVGGSATGRIDYEGDRDWFAVELEAGKSYRIDLEGPYTGGGTLDDPYLRGIHDSNGDLIPGTEMDDGGHRLNSRISFSPDAAGTYYIAAGADWGVGTYELSVEEVL